MIKRFVEWFNECMPVEESVGLHENKAFRRWVGYPLLIILLLFIAITWDLYNAGVYSFSKSFLINSTTLNGFAKFYAFPIAALAVPLTFGVMFNRFHSSKQKAKSNQLIEQNNSANIYFSHFAYFSEYTKEIDNKDEVLKKGTFKIDLSAQLAYRRIFTNSTISNSDFNIPKSVVDELVDELSKEFLSFNKYVIDAYNGPYFSNFEIEGFKPTRAVNNKESFKNMVKSYFHVYQELFKFQGTTNTNEILDYLSTAERNFFETYYPKK
ncbi:hypothetical protein [Pseudoalteromonas neustonica]|uniref:hypothetical protein n=1 Tax=Pseudoalteromonas neustonica TaxID=1840331 RepID=UPI0007DB2C5E|nr:hypothetical protein [Pseudoalteromonas neustonica]